MSTSSTAPLRILMSREAAERLGDAVRARAGARHCIVTAPGDAQAAQAEIAFVSRDVTGLSTKHEIQPATQAMYDALRAAPGLRWLHVHSAGADRPVYVELMARGVPLTTSSGANATVVAQTALLGLLALARHWPLLLQARRDKRWAPLIGSGLPRDLQGQTAVIVGWGPVGQEIARLMQAVSLRCIAVRRQAGGADTAPRTVAYAQLRDVLPEADWLVLACPLNATTRGLIGATELALLPAHAGLVNVARGDVVDEPALIDALRTHRLLGAYLDVFAHEPLPADSPLWTLPNVLLTPHSAGFSDGNEDRVAQMFLDNLARYTAGQPLHGLAAPPDLR